MSFRNILDDTGKIDARYLPTSSGPTTPPTLEEVLAQGNNNGNYSIVNSSGSYFKMDGSILEIKNPTTTPSQDAKLWMNSLGDIQLQPALSRGLNLGTALIAVPQTNELLLTMNLSGDVGVQVQQKTNKTESLSMIATTINLNYIELSNFVYMTIEPFSFTNGASFGYLQTTTALPTNLRPVRNTSQLIRVKYVDGGGTSYEAQILTINTDGTLRFDRVSGAAYATSSTLDVENNFGFSYPLL